MTDAKKEKDRRFGDELKQQIREHAARKVTNMTEQEVRINLSRIRKVLADEAEEKAKAAADEAAGIKKKALY